MIWDIQGIRFAAEQDTVYLTDFKGHVNSLCLEHLEKVDSLAEVLRRHGYAVEQGFDSEFCDKVVKYFISQKEKKISETERTLKNKEKLLKDKNNDKDKEKDKLKERLDKLNSALSLYKKILQNLEER